MTWAFNDAEDAEALLGPALAEHRKLLYERPRPALQRLRAYCDALAVLIEERDGLLAPEPAKVSEALRQAERQPPKRVELTMTTPNRNSQNLLACSRGAHTYGAFNGRYAECVSCGNRVITDPANRGAYDMSPQSPGDM